MTAVLVEQDLLQACQVIFGDELNISREFLEYVQLSGVKSAYRKRAKETHPDSLVGQGQVAQLRGAQQFQRVQKAYKNLSFYLDAREKGVRVAVVSPVAPTNPYQAGRTARTDFNRKRAQARHRKKPSGSAGQGCGYSKERPSHNGTQGNLFSGRLPNRPLLFGHFLYYSGLVSWQSLIKALVWQRSSRPRLGEIGCRFGWLSPDDVFSLLRSPDGRPLGQRAVDRGLLTPRQLNTLLAIQKSQQKRLGEYFVQNRIFEKARLQEILSRHYVHNYRQSKRARQAC